MAGSRNAGKRDAGFPGLRLRRATFVPAAFVVLAGLVAPVGAATLYWDADGTGTVAGGAGTWSNGGVRWSTTATGTTYQAWNNAGNDDAVLQNSAGVVTLGSAVTAKSITFGTTNYTLTGSNVITLAGGTGIIDTGTFSATINSVIAGSTGLTKKGTGSLVLDGVNTYTGASAVNEGTLRINGSTPAGSAVTIAAGATLGGAGTVNGTVTAALGARIDPGAFATTIASLTTGAFVWHGSSDGSATMMFDSETSGASSDNLVVNGNFTKGTGPTFKFDFRNGGGSGTYTLVRTVGGTHNFAASDLSIVNVKAGLVTSFDVSDPTRIKLVIQGDVPPTISVGAPSITATNTGPVTYSVTYTDSNFDYSSLAPENVTLNRTGTANGVVSVSVNGNAGTVTISSITGEGTLGISIAHGTAADTAGNVAPASGPSATFEVDNTAPTVTSGGAVNIAYGSAVSYTMTTNVAATKTAENLPAGASFDSSSGLISGTPTVAGTFNVILTASDTVGNKTSKTLVLTVAPKAVTISGLVVRPKVYDGTTQATLFFQYPLEQTLAGVLGVDLANVSLFTSAATAVFADPNVGTSKPVTITGLALTGTAASNYSLTIPTVTGTITGTVATVTLGNLAHTYDGTAKAATATTTPTGLSVNLTYDGSATAPTNAGSYAVSATITSSGYAGSATGTLTIAKANQTITFSAPANLMVGQPSTLTASASSGLPVTFAVVSGPATLSGATISPIGSGVVTVRASQAGSSNYNVAVDVDRSVTVGGASQTITFTPPSEIMVAQSVTLTAAASSGLPVTFSVISGPGVISGSTLTATGPGAIVVRASQAGNASFNAVDLDRTLTGTKASQSITFAQPADLTVGQTASLTAVASSGLAATLTIVSGPATISGNTITPTGLGAVVVRASQAGNTSYSAAADVERTFTVSKGSQTITFVQPADVVATQTLSLTASASSGLPVTFSVVSGPATVSGSTVTPTGSGTVVVRASQAGNSNYSAAADVDRTLTVTKAGQTISFAQPTDLAVARPATLSATASSGLAVTFTLVSGPATVAGSTLTPTGTGTIVVRASQSGNAIYSAAADSDRTLTITTISQTITFAALADKFVSDPSFALTASASSGLPLSFAISGPASITGSTVTLTGAEGVVSITASQPGNANYSAAASVTRTFAVRPLPLAGINFGAFSGDAAGAGFAMLVRADGTAVFTGFLPRLGQGLLAEGFTVDRLGQFVVTLTPVQLAGQEASILADRPIAAAAAPITLRGRIGGDGSVTGAIDGVGISFAGSASPATGAASASAGLYRVIDVGTGGTSTTLLLAGADGRAYVYRTDGVRASGSSATVGAGGTVVTTLPDQSRISLTVDGASKTAAGTLTSAAGVTSSLYGATDGVVENQRLINMSTLGLTSDTPESTLITGFVVRGDAPKRLLIRVAGPALAPLGVVGAVANPSLQLFAGTTQIAINDDWEVPFTQDIATLMTSVGAFPFAAGSRDAALIVRLTAGNYSVQAKGGNGMVITELYELPESGEVPGARRLVNISTRGTVSVGGSPLTAGFVISGPLPKKVLVRGVGPGLTAFGVAGAIANPSLRLYSGQTVVKQNDDWFRDSDAAQISAAATASGAFAFGAQSLDSALVVILQPGNYTAQIASVSGPSGVALVEVYELP